MTMGRGCSSRFGREFGGQAAINHRIQEDQV